MRSETDPQNVPVDMGYSCGLSVVVCYDYVKEEHVVLEQAKTEDPSLYTSHFVPNLDVDTAVLSSWDFDAGRN